MRLLIKQNSERDCEENSERIKMKEIVTLGDLELNLEELASFLVDANKEAYSGQNRHLLTDVGTKKFVFRDKKGKFYFSDESRGDYQFGGTKTVEMDAHKADLPEGDWRTIWQMNYFGGVLPEFIGDKKIAEQVESVLRKALSQITIEKPFRGPGHYSEGIGIYNLPEFRGDIKKFKGTEEMGLTEVPKNYRKRGDTGRYPVYSLDFHGGLII